MARSKNNEVTHGLSGKIGAYSGATSEIIRVEVTDDYMVKDVEVIITGGNSSLIEKGKAVQDADGLHWKYVITMPNTTLNGTKIRIAAFDLPANLASAEKVLDTGLIIA
jgi:hypothetical protein